ncbi:MAG TPA: hypothetical protein PKD54_13885, partial [Pirellulaceae bacterium]|nr:hypothetical protein [Pirellulaceae bacterium]
KRIAAVNDSTRHGPRLEVFQRTITGAEPGYGYLIRSEEFDLYGHRRLRIWDARSSRVVDVVQGITAIRPRYCELETLIGGEGQQRRWNMRIPTAAVPEEALRSVLNKQIADPNDPGEHFRIFELYIEARFFDMALQQLDLMQTLFPDLKDQLARDRRLVASARGRQLLDEIRLRLDVGQPNLAYNFAQAINKDEMSEEVQISYFQLMDEINQRTQDVEQVRTMMTNFLTDYLTHQVVDDDQRRVLAEFQQELDQALNTHTSGRLALFRRLVSDETLSLQQRLALGLSGWLLGAQEAIDNLATAESLWPVRQLVREYLGSATAARREEILKELEQYEGGTPRYLVPLIRQMGPIRPAELTEYDGSEPLRLQFQIPGTPFTGNQAQTIEYWVHLPPEYDPRRDYPLLITLPSQNSATSQLNLWSGNYNPRLGVRSGQAMPHGYIAAAVDWKAAGQNTYGYSEREHAIVLGCLRDCLRRFSVDSDAVFLSGHGEGAAAALDIGVSHPEHFAGLSTFAGGADKYVKAYQDNQHFGLPVYAVFGARDVVTKSKCQPYFDWWLRRANRNELTVVEYHGRLDESFMEEQAEVFRWFGTLRRRGPERGADLKLNYLVLRPTDVYSWCYEVRNISDEYLMYPHQYRDQRPRELKVSVERPAGSNKITIQRSTGEGTLWLSPDIVDFDQLVEISLRGGTNFRDFIQPSRRVILEDVRTRADRRRPYWAKLIEIGGRWSVQN